MRLFDLILLPGVFTFTAAIGSNEKTLLNAHANDLDTKGVERVFQEIKRGEGDRKRVLEGVPTKYPTWSPTDRPTPAPTGTPTISPVAPPAPTHYYMYTYYGCYKDSNTDRALSHKVGFFNTAVECAKACGELGYDFFGRQYYQSCWCGSEDHYDKHGLTTGCECESTGNIGTSMNCVYRVYHASTSIPKHVIQLSGMACATLTGYDNGSPIDFPSCPTGAGSETWVKDGEQVKHTNGKCMHLNLIHINVNKTEVDLAIWQCLEKDDPKYPNQVFDYESMCSDCVNELRSGTGYEGKCNGFTGICESGALWNKHYVPEDLHLLFKSCEDIMEFDNEATSGVYVIQPISMKYPLKVYCKMDINEISGDYIDLYAPNYSISPEEGRTDFTKVKLDTVSMEIQTHDLEFATSSAALVPFAQAESCTQNHYGTSRIDLTGTVFQIVGTFAVYGTGTMGTSVRKRNDRKIIDLAGKGNCGSLRSASENGMGLLIETALSTNCAEIMASVPSAKSGEYVILPAGAPAEVTVHCDMNHPSGTPADYIPLRFPNYSESDDGRRTDFSQIKIDWETMTIDVNDTVYATSIGEFLPFGTATSCTGAYEVNGTAQIDLTDTIFQVVDLFEVEGTDVAGTIVNMPGATQTFTMYGGGDCGSLKHADESGLKVDFYV